MLCTLLHALELGLALFTAVNTLAESMNPSFRRLAISSSLLLWRITM